MESWAPLLYSATLMIFEYDEHFLWQHILMSGSWAQATNIFHVVTIYIEDSEVVPQK
jgi:hypothetical protein